MLKRKAILDYSGIPHLKQSKQELCSRPEFSTKYPFFSVARTFSTREVGP